MTHEEQRATLNVADTHLERGDYDTAFVMANEVLGALELSNGKNSGDNANSNTHRSEALRLLGVVAFHRGEYQRALEHFDTTLNLCEQNSDTAGTAKTVAHIGQVYVRLSDFPRALDYTNRALELDRQIGNTDGVARHTGSLGFIYQVLSDFPRALEYHRSALELDEQIDNAPGMAQHFGNIGNVYRLLSDYTSALEYLSRALDIDEQLGNKAGVARHSGSMGTVYQNLSDYPRALEYFGKALLLDEQRGNNLGVAYWLCEIGIVHNNLADYPLALEHYFKSLRLYEQLGNKSGIALVFANIGGVYLNLGDNESALRYFSNALEIDTSLGIRQGEAIHSGNIGLIYSELGDYEKATGYLTHAVKVCEEISARRPLGFWLTGLGNVNAALGHTDEALSYLQRSLQLRREELQTNEGVSSTLIAMGELYARQELFNVAMNLLNEGLLLAENLGEKAEQSKAHKQLATLLATAGQGVEAYEHLLQHLELEKHMQSQASKKKAMQLEFERREAEKDKLREIEKAAATAEMNATQNLLHKVLPSAIASRLLNGEKVADYFTDVSILFADIVGFTSIASRMPAKAVLAFLNHVFATFDTITRKHGCEKIKTIGDGYMAIAGAPTPCSDHAERVARCALEMLKDLGLPQDISKYMPKDWVFRVRIGLHTGPVFAGIVGEERFVYDIYSDAVNTASRMESHGEAGKIHVSGDFAFHLQNRIDVHETETQDLASLLFTERQEIDIKGKGMMRTYFLEKA